MPLFIRSITCPFDPVAAGSLHDFAIGHAPRRCRYNKHIPAVDQKVLTFYPPKPSLQGRAPKGVALRNPKGLALIRSNEVNFW
jgi:hypothetical protein